jgi:methylase of polypeptide subunit release factors
MTCRNLVAAALAGGSLPCLACRAARRTVTLAQPGAVISRASRGERITLASERYLVRLLRRVVHQGRSLQHAIGLWDFLALPSILVPWGVLAPRPETELLAELAIHTVCAMQAGRSPLSALGVALRRYPARTLGASAALALEFGQRAMKNESRGGDTLVVVDAGSGTGVIGISVAQHGAAVWAVDIDPVAIKTSQFNARAAGVELHTVLADAGEGPWTAAPPADLIVGNPPYLPRGITVAPHVAQNEPPRALFGGGIAGLETSLRWLLNWAERGWVRPGGLVLLELHEGHPLLVHSLFAPRGQSLLDRSQQALPRSEWDDDACWNDALATTKEAFSRTIRRRYQWVAALEDQYGRVRFLALQCATTGPDCAAETVR